MEQESPLYSPRPSSRIDEGMNPACTPVSPGNEWTRTRMPQFNKTIRYDGHAGRESDLCMWHTFCTFEEGSFLFSNVICERWDHSVR